VKELKEQGNTPKSFTTEYVHREPERVPESKEQRENHHMKNFNLNQIVNAVTTSNLFIKGGSTVLIVLSIVIVWQLMNHGNAALGAYMLIEK
jgi:hypothetical protein